MDIPDATSSWGDAVVVPAYRREILRQTAVCAPLYPSGGAR
jgi:hypothetical protein